MVISSIDLKNGHVVQLKNGKELVLQRDDADALIRQFNYFGEVAIIDLDAALGNVDAKGKTVNTALLQKLLHQGNVRTGGGIRTVKRAKELISLGAEKVIIGSAAWNKEPDKDGSVLNEAFPILLFLQRWKLRLQQQHGNGLPDAIRGHNPYLFPACILLFLHM